MSWKVEVIADASGEWLSKGLYFLTESEARGYGENLWWRLNFVRKMRVAESRERINARWIDFKLERL